MAVRIPRDIAAVTGIADGVRIEIEAREGDIVITLATPRFSAQELFEGKSAADWRAAYRDAFDWGPDLGREAVEE